MATKPAIVPAVINVVKFGNHCEVDPAQFHATPGTQVRWHNGTKKEIVVLFPDHQQVFGERATAEMRVPSGQDSSILVVQKEAGNPPNHRYVVFCEETRSFAYGNSDAEFVVP